MYFTKTAEDTLEQLKKSWSRLEQLMVVSFGKWPVFLEITPTAFVVDGFVPYLVPF